MGICSHMCVQVDGRPEEGTGSSELASWVVMGAPEVLGAGN